MGPGNRPSTWTGWRTSSSSPRAAIFRAAAQAQHIAQPAFSRHTNRSKWAVLICFDRTTHPVIADCRRQAPIRCRDRRRCSAGRGTFRRRAPAHEQAAVSCEFAATHALPLTFFPTWLGRVEARLPVGRKMGPIQMVSDSFARL